MFSRGVQNSAAELRRRRVLGDSSNFSGLRQPLPSQVWLGKRSGKMTTSANLAAGFASESFMPANLDAFNSMRLNGPGMQLSNKT